MVTIYYTYFDSPLEHDVFYDFLHFLPVEERFNNARYKHWQDRHRHLFSRLLLMHAADVLGVADSIFPLKRYKNGKPYSDLFYFNISHSGNFAAVAVSKSIEIGLDIQKISDVSVDSPQFFLTEEESAGMALSSLSLKAVADLWSMKEAVAKANGKGLLLPFSKINVEKGSASIDNKQWFLKELTLNAAYTCWLATSSIVSDPAYHYIDIRSFAAARI
ncbi:MAG: 4'-phosphopantetheinyl transferase family protein [Cytophaga sp.]|uniref:4'-phosphopantetheinyl transferase family protein n=1 Tax=Cytophaga sp. TaxID=29535 RepID=UPI003F80AD88